MPGLWEQLTEKLGGITAKWASFAAFGSFTIYLLGYLALRFQLSTYGVATDLYVWDERYLFAGSRFLVYLVSFIPSVFLIVFVLAALVYVPYKLLPALLKNRANQRLKAWVSRPAALPLSGVLLAVALIQFVMRKCFVFGNLLFREQLPGHEWINAILLSDNLSRSFYFTGLVGGTLATGVVLFLIPHTSYPTTLFSKVLVTLLSFLFSVEFLLLPVNYGILIASQELPRVSDLAAGEKLASGDEAWLVWESKEATVFFVRSAHDKRSMITTPKKDGKITIVGYDRIFCVLFGPGKPDP